MRSRPAPPCTRTHYGFSADGHRDPAHAVNQMMAEFPLDLGGDAVEQRAAFERMMTAQPLPDDVITSSGSLGAVPTLEIATAGIRSDAVLLWFHGGWYTMGSPRTVASLSSEVARRTGAKVVSVDYRLAPEHPFPAALQDARAAYHALLESGVSPQDVAMVGESAGGGLVVSALVSFAEEGLPSRQPPCCSRCGRTSR